MAGALLCRDGAADGWGAGEDWLELRITERTWFVKEIFDALGALGYEQRTEKPPSGWTRYTVSRKWEERGEYYGDQFIADEVVCRTCHKWEKP